VGRRPAGCSALAQAAPPARCLCPVKHDAKVQADHGWWPPAGGNCLAAPIAF